MKNYGKFVVGLVLIWFIFALTASARGVFNNGANRFGFAVAFAALTRLSCSSYGSPLHPDLDSSHYPSTLAF